MTHTKVLTALTSLCLLSACATRPTPSPYQTSAENALVQVNLLLNSGEIVDSRTAEELYFLRRQIVESGLFSKVQMGVSPWPFTVKMSADMDCNGNPAEVFAGLATAFTLFLVPHHETCVYSIKATFYDGAKIVSERQYSTPYTKTIEMLGYTQVEGNKQGFSAVFRKMYEDCVSNPPLPRAKATKVNTAI